ncbi:MAG: superoxide dismutase [Bacilli bacterium]|nr:superoxide dismutase [Clostridium sp.]MDY2803989.1 superoxide dismutase [Bacilli bacterium]
MEYKRITLDYKSLEPYIDDRTLDLHYNAHYRNYTDKLNKYLNDINYDYKDSPEYLAKHIDILPMENRDEILFNLGGYLNHSLYFYNLTNKKKDIPIELLNLINKYFGSFSLFKEEFIDMAMEVKGSGYTFLVMDKNNKLRIINTSNQDTPYYYGFTPIMTIDVWEHAYYLKYTYLRKKYLENIFDIIDFDKVYKLYLDNIV